MECTLWSVQAVAAAAACHCMWRR